MRTVRPPKKVATKKVTKKKSQSGSIWNRIKSKVLPKKKRVSKSAKKEARRASRRQVMRGIIGIGLLFVVVSIAYSTYMTSLFVDGRVMVAALAPQVAFAMIVLVIAFYKIFK